MSNKRFGFASTRAGFGFVHKRRPRPRRRVSVSSDRGRVIIADAIAKMHAAGLSRSEIEQIVVDFAEVMIDARSEEIPG